MKKKATPRKSAKKSATSKAGARKPKPKNIDDYVYHYIAYVPVGDELWELDGMEKNPRFCGKQLASST